ncbi:uncharacterized protein LOC115413890 isoform X2 [Sphaeramia orbicularis]|uniref:uncharacterized protein LOC115413890 isoform X2 n=1 Tax=Sphaeramia orbicularis TaxID=375764 RepID=UPI00117F4EB6|nr:uncharacterized protein LOC115413890 isoform X2 [Sphaeramia orbicularis]
MDPRCSHCSAPIPRQAKGYRRKSLLSVVDPRSASLLFPHLRHEDAFLCYACVRFVFTRTKRRGKRRVCPELLKPGTGTPEPQDGPEFKRSGPFSPLAEHDYTAPDPARSPGPGPSQTRARPRGRPRIGTVSEACDRLSRRRFGSGLRRMLQVPGFKKSLIRVCSGIINKERVQMLRDMDGPYRKPFSTDSQSEFRWDQTTSWAESKAPLTVACLRSMFPPTNRIRKQSYSDCTGRRSRRLTESEVGQMLDRRLSVLLSVPLYTGSRRAGLVQTALGVELLRHRCPLKVFNVLNGLGLSQCKSSSRTQAHRVHQDHQGQVRTWKDQIQLSGRIHQCSEESKKATGYAFSWSRVRVPSPFRTDPSQRPHSVVTWAFRFAHQSRVNFRAVRGVQVRAAQVSPSSVLPSRQTYERLRQRMKTMVMRIIVDQLTALKKLRMQVERHTPHLYSRLMKEKSTTVSLGAVVPDPSEESVSAALGLKDYVPELYQKPFHLLYCGDGLDRDRPEHANGTCDPPPTGAKADGLIEVPPEFQREQLFHEEMLKLLLKDTSEPSRGSLQHILSLFQFQTFNAAAKDHFLNTWDFITFVTAAYVTLFAVTQLDLDSVHQRPSGFPSEVEDQMRCLGDLAHRLVDLVWMAPPQEDVNTAATAATDDDGQQQKNVYPFCYCRRDRPGDQLIRCCSNVCPGIWFHQTCAQTRTGLDLMEDWFCSPGCREDGSYIYCHCKERRGGQMVQCGQMDRCRRHQWYHRDCLSPQEQDHSQTASWFCSDACSRASEGDDFLLNYTKAVVWEGLYHMTRRDAIQEGDGESMTDFCRTDLVLLWTRNHLGLFRSYHQMLTGMEGFYPARVRQDLKWNRVVNPQGTAGGNVSLDLMTELMVNEFKGAIEFGKGSFRPAQVDQSAQLAGPQAQHLDRFFSSSRSPTLTRYLTRLKTSTCRWREDVDRFVSEFRADHLFSFRPGRGHQGFNRFTYDSRVQTPDKMGRTMWTLSQDLDRRRDQIL